MVHSDVVKTQQVGLMLPNGETVWVPETYRNFSILTPEDRWHLLQRLKKLSEEISFIESDLLSNYGWVVRDVFVTRVYLDPTVVPIEHEALVKEPEPEDKDVETGDSGEGPLRDGETGDPGVTEDSGATTTS